MKNCWLKVGIYGRRSLSADKKPSYWNMANTAAELLAKLLANPRVRVGDPLAVQTKLYGIVDAGFEKLLVISDFDHTLSAHLKNGVRNSTSHGVFEINPNPERYGFTKEWQQEITSVCKKYLQIEFCPVMSVKEKIPHMVDWWEYSHRRLIDTKFTRDTVRRIALEAKIALRENAITFLRCVDTCNVPIILFSAGIGDVISAILKNEMGEQLPRSLHIVSNMMIYDEKDVCVAFTEPIIHTFSKNSSVIPHDAPFYKDIEGRSCVMLLGDSLGDVHMDIGIVGESIVLKIGFLNFNADKLLERYMNEYDIVVIDDQTFDVPLSIVNSIRTEIIEHNIPNSKSKVISEKVDPQVEKKLAA